MDGCLAGEPKAWHEMVHRYSDLVYSIPRNLGLDDHMVEDVFQTIWAAVVHQLAQLRERSRFKSWLVSIAYRQTKAAIRKIATERPHEPAEFHDHPMLVDHETVRIWDEELDRRRLVAIGLEELDSPCRALLEDLYMVEEKLSYKEIARKFDISLGSIGPTRSRCLDKLRKIVDRIDRKDMY